MAKWLKNFLSCDNIACSRSTRRRHLGRAASYFSAKLWTPPNSVQEINYHYSTIFIHQHATTDSCGLLQKQLGLLSALFCIEVVNVAAALVADWAVAMPC